MNEWVRNTAAGVAVGALSLVAGRGVVHSEGRVPPIEQTPAASLEVPGIYQELTLPPTVEVSDETLQNLIASGIPIYPFNPDSISKTFGVVNLVNGIPESYAIYTQLNDNTTVSASISGRVAFTIVDQGHDVDPLRSRQPDTRIGIVTITSMPAEDATAARPNPSNYDPRPSEPAYADRIANKPTSLKHETASLPTVITITTAPQFVQTRYGDEDMVTTGDDLGIQINPGRPQIPVKPGGKGIITDVTNNWFDIEISQDSQSITFDDPSATHTQGGLLNIFANDGNGNLYIYTPSLHQSPQ